MFPSWINKLRTVIVLAVVLLPTFIAWVVLYGASPRATDVGYQPIQPVPFSHALHAGDLGMDCRYCHTAVERAAQATLPTTAICMNCHQKILGTSDKLLPVRQAFATGLPVHWVRVHDLPDFAYFDHSAHVRRGVGCVSCHGRIDQMDERGVYQAQPLSMGWCLECHRNPAPHLRPIDQVTVMEPQFSAADDRDATNTSDKNQLRDLIRPSTDCSTCHR